jgi:membrane protein
VFATFDIPLGWGELLKRTAREARDDDCLGMAAQLAYYFFFALFPAFLFVLAFASFFTLSSFVSDAVRALRPVATAEVLELLEAQLKRLSDANDGGILTIGLLGAVWSSSAALVGIIDSLNRAYDLVEARPWWKVRLTAMVLTIALAVLGLVALILITVGPGAAARLAESYGLGSAFAQTWNVVQWPVAFCLMSTAIGLVYYFAPDADQDWVWTTPGAVLATLLWFAASLGFKFYIANFTDYNASYGAVGAVMVLLLWFYMTGLAILLGAELNAEIEHASPWGKAKGEKVPGQRKKIGLAAARAYGNRRV